MRVTNLSNRKYLIGFLCLTILNILLVVFLLNSVLAQTSLDKSLKNQPPIVAEIVRQEGSPMLLTISSVDNTSEEYQTIKYIIQNVSEKKIRACVVLYADEFNVGGSSISIFPSLALGQAAQESHAEARTNIKANGKMFLSLDYVEFEDGSSWGKDTQQQSEYISGHSEGEKNAVKQIRQLLTSQNKDAVSELLKKEVSEITPPDISPKKTAKWQYGFTSGYRSVLIRLQFAHERQGMEGVSLKLEEIEKLTKKGEK